MKLETSESYSSLECPHCGSSLLFLCQPALEQDRKSALSEQNIDGEKCLTADLDFFCKKCKTALRLVIQQWLDGCNIYWSTC